MASKTFARATSRWMLTGTASVGVVTYLAHAKAVTHLDDGDLQITPAEQQFNAAHQAKFAPPKNWSGPVFKLRNDYPRTSAASLPPLPGPGLPLPGGDDLADAPWLKIDFRKEPAKYAKIVKEYCWTGNVNNDFDVTKNELRDWYHAPWMHYSDNGREPLHGLTFERPTPVGELSSKQNRILQAWACGFYNSYGASVFGQAWADPNNPKWDTNLKFPPRTAVFKILMSDATNEEVFSMAGAPSLKAVIAKPLQKPSDSGKDRNDFASDVRLIQVDWATRDDRSEIGWVFGTFMYDGSQRDSNPWDRIIPVGVMWGNDPELTDAKAAAGAKPVESWINPEAEALRKALGGKRPTWGWKGRLNGPADNYISACASCHSTAERHLQNLDRTSMIPQKPDIMKWFRNVPAGEPFTQDGKHVSSDYSLQFMMGYYNYLQWRRDTKSFLSKTWENTKYVVPFSKTRKEVDTISTIASMSRDDSTEELTYDE